MPDRHNEQDLRTVFLAKGLLVLQLVKLQILNLRQIRKQTVGEMAEWFKAHAWKV